MIEKKESPAGKQGQSDTQYKYTNSSRIIQQVRSIFSSGRSVTAKQINQELQFNDARKVISTLRAQGWDIKDVRLDDGCKLYWLEQDTRQLSLFGKEGGAK